MAFHVDSGGAAGEGNGGATRRRMRMQIRGGGGARSYRLHAAVTDTDIDTRHHRIQLVTPRILTVGLGRVHRRRIVPYV